MNTIIENGTIVNEGKVCRGSVVIQDDRISEIIFSTEPPRGNYDKRVDATGCFVLPGVIDEHVHFRQPGMTDKGDIESESRAAAMGGVTSFFDMPNTNPMTTTLETLDEKIQMAVRDSHINYSFFFGATNQNSSLFKHLDPHIIPGIKVFMGASTGNMLVDNSRALEKIFQTAAFLNLPVMTHCEDSAMITANMKIAKEKYGDDPDVIHHYEIRNADACHHSSKLAIELAKRFGTQLHIAHLSTAKELSLIDDVEVCKLVTLEAVIAHLVFTNEDYLTKKALIKCNPSVKTAADRDALRRALANGKISTVGTDHAPHLLSQKQGGCCRAASGMPMIQFSLVTMLELVDKSVITIERLVELMSHAPAKLFRVNERGFLRPGYKADITIVSCKHPWQVTENTIVSKCKWSPMLGHEYRWKVIHTFCNGNHLLNGTTFNPDYRGEQITFRN